MVPDHSPSTDERASLAQPSQFSSPLECTSHLGFSLDTHPYALEQHGVRKDLIFVFVDDITGTTFKRPGWEQLMERVQPGGTIVVCNLARFSRNFEEGVANEADLTRRKI